MQRLVRRLVSCQVILASRFAASGCFNVRNSSKTQVFVVNPPFSWFCLRSLLILETRMEMESRLILVGVTASVPLAGCLQHAYDSVDPPQPTLTLLNPY